MENQIEDISDAYQKLIEKNKFNFWVNPKLVFFINFTSMILE